MALVFGLLALGIFGWIYISEYLEARALEWDVITIVRNRMNTHAEAAGRIVRFDFKFVRGGIRVENVGRIEHFIPTRMYTDVLYLETVSMSLAIHGEEREPVLAMMLEYYPALNEWTLCPVCDRLRRLAETIVGLNDDHGWTRQEIADWLETLDFDITLERI